MTSVMFLYTVKHDRGHILSLSVVQVVTLVELGGYCLTVDKVNLGSWQHMQVARLAQDISNAEPDTHAKKRKRIKH